MYGSKTADEEFIRKVGEISKNYPGRWGTLQYNPDGPEGSMEGYSKQEYMRRLKLIISADVRVIGVHQWGAGLSEKHFIRSNFLLAVKELLLEE